MTQKLMTSKRCNRVAVTRKVQIGEGCPLVLIAGPCVIESETHALRHARKIKAIARQHQVPFIFKASYDKANRTSVQSYRGPGIELGLAVLRRIKEELDIPVLSDVHRTDEVERAAEVLDVLQIPAFLCRQTDLVLEAARTGKTVNVKKGQFMAPEDMLNVVEKIRQTGNEKILLTERGVSFGYRTLVSDFRSLVIMRQMGCPVVFDATHSVQQPGGLGKASGGQREFIVPLAQAGVVVGADAIFMEVHENPDRALSDGPNNLALKDLSKLLKKLKQLSKLSYRLDGK